MKLLEKNGRESITQRTKHIRVQYFVIKDRIAVGDVTLEHFPMDKILGYHLHKASTGLAVQDILHGDPMDP